MTSWRRSVGGIISDDGVWSIRGPILGKPMYWLYVREMREYSAHRFTPTGHFAHAVNFSTVDAAKHFVEQQRADPQSRFFVAPHL